MINIKDEKLVEKLMTRIKDIGCEPKFVDGIPKYFFPQVAQPAIRFKKKPIGKILYVTQDQFVGIEMTDNKSLNYLFNNKYKRLITI